MLPLFFRVFNSYFVLLIPFSLVLIFYFFLGFSLPGFILLFLHSMCLLSVEMYICMRNLENWIKKRLENDTLPSVFRSLVCLVSPFILSFYCVLFHFSPFAMYYYLFSFYISTSILFEFSFILFFFCSKNIVYSFQIWNRRKQFPRAMKEWNCDGKSNGK